VYVATIIESVFGVEDDEAKASTTETNSQGRDDLKETPLDAERSHEAGIAESIRKLRELEKDRPLWEDDACKGRLVSVLINRSDLPRLGGDEKKKSSD
jgi:hypothetical protein